MIPEECKRLAVEEAQAGRDLSLNDLLLHALHQERSLDTPRAAALLQRPDSKARAYHLSAATYRRLGDSAGYVRQRGFEPYQHEQMVLQYVQKHGRITRKEAAELCRLAPSQARNLLMKMKKEGHLAVRGERRGAFYVLPSN